MRNEVILVDENDTTIGRMDKMEVHQKALLHRAVSVFIINSRGEWILQRRAEGKYHSAGQWSNTCCTHPMPGETVEEAASKRLMEEMGMTCIPMHKAFHFIYKAKLDGELTEHELDHVFYGFCDEHPRINPTEVMEWKAAHPNMIEADINANPQNYTIWFRILFPRMKTFLEKMSQSTF
ncbi:MAG: isopentenyl-diphosphate Delta-isomerase [Bacteroidales bacterium]|nr:isopentenyl-diphosphate Delta-isomerase [Bacteroidales bacterium]